MLSKKEILFSIRKYVQHLKDYELERLLADDVIKISEEESHDETGCFERDLNIKLTKDRSIFIWCDGQRDYYKNYYKIDVIPSGEHSKIEQHIKEGKEYILEKVKFGYITNNWPYRLKEQ